MMRMVGIACRVASGVALAAWLSGCASTHVGYGDATESKPLTTDFGSSDLQQIAAAMVDSMLVFPPVVQATSQRRPVVSVDKVRNKTMQHIDLEGVTDTIRAKLIKSGKFQFIDRTNDAANLEEVQKQTAGGLTDPTKSAGYRTQEAAEYMIYGNLMEITQSAGNVKDVYYKFTLNLKNLKSGVLEWSDEKEIRKVRSRSAFGR